MKEHAAYRTNYMEKNIALVFGPVFDKSGAWKFGIMETEDGSEANKIISNDPTVKAKPHTFEICPMNAVYKRK